MIHLQVRAGFWEQALPVPACPRLQLLSAGRLVKIRRRSSDIVDVPFEIRILRQKPCLVQDRLIAPCLNDPPLVEVQCAEIARPEASTVGRDGKLHLRKCGDSACLIIIRMPGPCIGKRVDIVHLLRRQRLRRGILDNIDRAVGLDQRPGIERIRVAILLVVAGGICQAV